MSEIGVLAPLVLGPALAGCVGTVGGPATGSADASADAAAPTLDAAAPGRPDAAPPPASGSATAIWLGTGAYDPAGEGRIDPYTLDADTLTPGTSTVVGSLPSWIATAPGGERLYAVDENNSRIRAYAVAAGRLTEIGAGVDSGGQGPVHVVVDRTGRWLLVAHYTSGTVSVLGIEASGALRAAPSDVETTGRLTHQVVLDPTNRFVFVPCVGDNHVAQLVFDAEAGTLSRNDPATVESAPGAGPRHLALHPDGAHAYVVDETGSTVTAYRLDASKGTLTREASVRTIPDDFPGNNTGAEIAIAADGDFVYTSNRGHDSIAVFGVGAGGVLTPVDRTPSGGAVPRSFAITPGGDRLIVANQESKSVVSFAIDPAAGTLSSPRPLVTTSAAVFFVGADAIPPPR